MMILILTFFKKNNFSDSEFFKKNNFSGSDFFFLFLTAGYLRGKLYCFSPAAWHICDRYVCIHIQACTCMHAGMYAWHGTFATGMYAYIYRHIAGM